MGKFDSNPFARSALKHSDIKLLAGRDNELKNIRFILRSAAKQQDSFRHIIISGNRGVGKTSFLNLIEGECPYNNLIPVRINLNDSNSQNPNEFFWHLFNQVFNVVLNLGFFKGTGGEIYNAIQNILLSDKSIDKAQVVFKTPVLRKRYLTTTNSIFEFDQFVADLKFIRKEIAESNNETFNITTKILFLVDETQKIYSNREIIQDLRYIIQQSDLGVGFVFAGDSSFSTLEWEKVFGGSHRDFDIIDLSNFNDVDAVIDYFTKSLQSIGWTSKDVEIDYFYRFHKACTHIFYLTSGRPEFINTIASKMFERCMKGETPVLKFDKLAQNDVKKLLESSKEIDSNIIDKIDNLSPKYRKWLSDLFDCEYSTFKSVYFFGKFKYLGEDFLTEEEFLQFCEILIKDGIITLYDEQKNKGVGFQINQRTNDLRDKRYFCFNNESDTIKLWLQINSDGFFEFGYNKPRLRYFFSINKQLATEINKIFIFHTQTKNPRDSDNMVKLFSNFSSHTKEIEEMPYDVINDLYKTCKQISDSRDRQILYGKFTNNISMLSSIFNITNFTYNNKGIPFFENEKPRQRIMSVVDSFNTHESNYSLELSIQSIQKPDIKVLQRIIIASGDKKKLGIIIEDKMADMVNYYIKESDVEASYKTALFFKGLFDEGFDLSIRELNNSAFVFISKELLDEAEMLLLEAKRKISFEELDDESLDSACFIFYNYGIFCVKKGKIDEALFNFRKILEINRVNEKICGDGPVLKLLKIDENNDLEIIEIKEGNPEYPKFTCKMFAEINISVLEQYKQKG